MTQSSESPHTYVMARSSGSLVFLHFSFILTISAGRDAITIVADADLRAWLSVHEGLIASRESISSYELLEQTQDFQTMPKMMWL
jgi:hypothetical protein